jgi:DNA polymerase III subunit alpha
VKLSSIGYTEGFYHKPRVDREVLERHSGGAHRQLRLHGRGGGPAPHGGERREGAREAAEWYANVFRDRYYLEVQGHDTEGQAELNRKIFALSEELGLPVVATNDAHFLEKRRPRGPRHPPLHRAGEGQVRPQPDALRRGALLQGPDEMRGLLPGRPDVIENTLRIADEVDLTFEKKYHVPEFPLPEAYATRTTTWSTSPREGAKERYGDPLPPEVKERMDFELGVILPDGVRRVLPHHLGLHPTGPGSTGSRWGRGGARRRAPW